MVTKIFSNKTCMIKKSTLQGFYLRPDQHGNKKK